MLEQRTQYCVMGMSFMVLNLMCSVPTWTMEMTDFTKGVLIFMASCFLVMQFVYLFKVWRYKEERTSEEKSTLPEK